MTEELKPKSRAEVNDIVLRHHYSACKIPKEWQHMIKDIVSNQMSALSESLGNLELCYRRTLQHAEELREMESEA